PDTHTAHAPPTRRSSDLRQPRTGGSSVRAVHDKAYLKSSLRFWGADLPAIRVAVREYCRAHPDLTRAELRAIAEALYETDVHELDRKSTRLNSSHEWISY